MTKKLILFIIGSAIIGSGAFFLFPHITGDVLQLKIIGGLALATTLVQVIAVYYFFTSLQAFRSQLRQAYKLLIVSISFLSIAQLLLLISFFFAPPDTLRNWLFVSTYVLSTAFGYLAMRQFSGLLNVPSRILRSPLIVFCISTVVGITILLLPHEDWGSDTFEVSMLFVSIMFSGTVSLMAALLAWRTKKALGGQYSKAVLWLAIAFVGLAIANYMEAITKVTGFLTTSWYYTYGLNILPEYLTGILFMGASIALKVISHERASLPEDASFIDVVTYAASLASDKAAIDKPLDKLRQITALQTPGEKLTDANRTILVELYLTIEKYLLTKEPLRRIERDNLRQKLPAAFQRELTTR